MGRSLLKQDPVFREVIEQCDLAMRPYGDWSLLAELTATDASKSRLSEVDIVQPALFAIQIALAALWRSWGIEPHAVIGHSMGEVAAAHVAGALSLEDAVRVICHRSQLVKRVTGQGAMAAVELSMEDARGVLGGYEDRVSIAASNSPTSVLLSGDPATLETILDRLRRREIFCAMVKVDFASHSPQMDPLRADLLDALKELKPQPAPVPIYSTVIGTLAQHFAFDAHYWARNLREPVLFSAAVQRLLEDGHDLFLEISSHPILLSSIQQGVHHFSKDADQPGTVLPSMRRDEAERTVMLGSLGALYSLGYPIDWKRIYPVARRCVSLPMHPWNRERCWMESGAGDSDPQWEQVPRGAKERHPLLGRHFKSAHPAGPHFWEVTLDKRVLPYLDDHRIEGVAVLPASAYVEMALAAAAEAFRAEPLEPAESFTSPGLAKAFTIKDFEFRRALFLPDGEARHLQLILSPESDGAASIQIYSRAAAMDEAGKSWTLHATGRVCPQPDGSVLPTRQETLAEIQARCPETISGSEYYAKLAESGVYYGPILKSITQLWRKGGDVLGELQLPEGPDTEFSKYQIHPASLDACLQAAGAALATEAVANGKQGIFMPTRIDEINVHSRPGSHLWSYARVKERDADTARGDARLLDDDGHALVEILGLRFDSLEGAARRAVEENVDDWLYEFQWKEKPRPKEQELKAEASSQLENTSQVKCGTWLIFADRCGVGEALALQLEGQGARSILVSCDDWYEATDNTHYRIRAENQEDLRQLFATALANPVGLAAALSIYGVSMLLRPMRSRSHR